MSVSDPSATVKSVRHKGRLWEQGFTMVPNALLLCGRLTGNELNVYIMFLYYAREDEKCWAGQEVMAMTLHMSESTLRRSIRQLEALGLIEVEQRGFGRTNVYLITDAEKVMEEWPIMMGAVQSELQEQSERPTSPVKMTDPYEEDAVELDAVEVKIGPASQVSSDLQKVYDHWRTKRGRTRSNYERIAPQRKQKIVSRLKEFSAEELIQAIDNLQYDPWPDRALHDDITVIFRSQCQVEKFLDLAEAVSGLDKTPNGSHPAPNWQDIIRAHDNGLVTA